MGLLYMNMCASNASFLFSFFHFQNINAAKSSFLPENEKKKLLYKLYDAYGMVKSTEF